jgi:hypothetical protein
MQRTSFRQPLSAMQGHNPLDTTCSLKKSYELAENTRLSVRVALQSISRKVRRYRPGTRIPRGSYLAVRCKCLFTTYALGQAAILHDLYIGSFGGRDSVVGNGESQRVCNVQSFIGTLLTTARNPKRKGKGLQNLMVGQFHPAPPSRASIPPSIPSMIHHL